MKISDRQVHIIEKVIISVIEAFGSIPNENKLIADAKRFLSDFSALESKRVFNFLLEIQNGTGEEITKKSIEHIYKLLFQNRIHTFGEFDEFTYMDLADLLRYNLAKKFGIKKVPISIYDFFDQIKKLENGESLCQRLNTLLYSLTSSNMDFFKIPKETQLKLILEKEITLKEGEPPIQALNRHQKKIIEEFLDYIYLWYDLYQDDNFRKRRIQKLGLPVDNNRKQSEITKHETDIQPENGYRQSMSNFMHQQILIWLLLSILHYKALYHNGEAKPSIHFDKLKELLATDDRNRCENIAAAAQRCNRVLHERIIGYSKPMIELKTKIWRACFGESLLSAFNYEEIIRKQNVLFLGESGVGKELCAEAIQEGVFWYGENEVPKVKINISALSYQLVESELFGHVKGAYTGAATARDGNILKANNAAST